jgi:hypothetical protein
MVVRDTSRCGLQSLQGRLFTPGVDLLWVWCHSISVLGS